MTRRRGLVAGVVVVAAVVAVVLLTRSGGGHGPGLPKVQPNETEGLRSAQDACTLMAQVESLVQANAPAKDVLATVDRAHTTGRTAAARDVHWISLSSGIDAVAVGLKHDDGNAARIGIRTVRSQCRAVPPPRQP